MVRPASSLAFDSFIDKMLVHDDISCGIARAQASIAETITKTRRTITESRKLLEQVSEIPEQH